MRDFITLAVVILISCAVLISVEAQETPVPQPTTTAILPTPTSVSMVTSIAPPEERSFWLDLLEYILAEMGSNILILIGIFFVLYAAWNILEKRVDTSQPTKEKLKQEEDIFTKYEMGVDYLLAKLDSSSSEYAQVLTYQQRMRENIS